MESHQLLQPAAPQEDSRIGMVLQDRYKIIRKLGEGGMGAVYEGEHVLIKRRVAIKCLHSQFAQSGDIVARFHREALAATSIGNEHIIEVTDMGRFPDGSVFMVLEYLAGHDLSHEIENKGPMPIARLVHVCVQVCEALGAAHEKGIVHRDLKPENVFLIARGGDPDFVKVLDFGISKFKDSGEGANHSMTRTGMAMGTPYYMAPEQAHGHRDLDHRVDLYALGVMMFRALTGTLPFDDESYPMLVVKICTQPPPSVRQFRPDVPPQLEAVVMRLLAKDKNARYPDCASVRAELMQFRNFNGAPMVSHGGDALAPPTPVLGTNVGNNTAASPNTQVPVAPVAAIPAPTSASMVSTTVPPISGAGSRIGLALGGLGVVVLLGTGVLFTMKRSEGPAVVATSQTPTGPAVATTPPAPPPTAANPAVQQGSTNTNPAAAARTVRVQISTAPNGAEIYLDGNRIANPFDADLPSSNEPHRLEARLGGYVTNIQDLSLVFGQRVVLQLRRGSGTEDHRAARTATPSSALANGSNDGNEGVIDPGQLAAARAHEPQPANPTVAAAGTHDSPAAHETAPPPSAGTEPTTNTHAEPHHAEPAVARSTPTAAAAPPAAADPPPPSNPAVVTPPTTQPLRRRAF